MEKEVEVKEKKHIKIAGITLWRIVAYFIIYSVAGFIIETIFGVLTKGVLESRKSFLYGPFCSIYGLGAVLMILPLQRFKKNNYTLFAAGFVIGSIIEYLVSLIGELIFHIKWWDYSESDTKFKWKNLCTIFTILGITCNIFNVRYQQKSRQTNRLFKEKDINGNFKNCGCSCQYIPCI